ncbi:MAG: hypothetical protein HQ567_30485 [Candidatus Nealsonbacteria bacterium]|nr:hypothetical protein [Candidatus Nealsonbacteria bacterium]
MDTNLSQAMAALTEPDPAVDVLKHASASRDVRLARLAQRALDQIGR